MVLASRPPTFLLLFLIIWLATLIADIFAYVRIINFMRLASVRINVLPDTDRERKKVKKSKMILTKRYLQSGGKLGDRELQPLSLVGFSWSNASMSSSHTPGFGPHAS